MMNEIKLPTPCNFCNGRGKRQGMLSIDTVRCMPCDGTGLLVEDTAPPVAEATPAQAVNCGELSAQHSWVGQLNGIEAGYSITASTNPHPDIIFNPMAGEAEVLRLTKDGFIYKGKVIEDAGEARAAMLKALGFATSPLNSSECIPAKTGTGASIDTAEYVTLKDALIQTGVNSSLSGHVNDVAAHLAADDVFAAHINAEMSSYGQQQYQAGRDSGLATVSNAYEIVVEEARKQNERAEKAEVALTSQAIEVEKMLCDALGQKWSAAGISVESLIAALAGRAAVADGAPPDIDASTVPLSQARRKIARLQAELAAKAVSPFSGNPAHTMARERAKGEFKTLRADWGSCSICAGTKTTFGKRCVCTQTEMEQ